MVKYNNFLLFLIIFIFIFTNVINSQIDIIKQTIVQQSYFYDNQPDSSKSGCNITLLVNIKYPSENGQIGSIKSLDNNYYFNSEILFSNDTYALFRLDGIIKVVGDSLNPAIEGLNGEMTFTINQPLSLSCFGPPLSPDLGIVILSNDSIIPISRKNEYLFEVAIKVSALTNYMDMSFIFANQLNSIPFSLFYEQLSINEFILKFKLKNPSLVQNLSLIEIIPQNIRGGGISVYPLNYTSFTITPSIKESNQLQFSNILFYPNGEEPTKEKFAYVTFDINNDDSIVPALVNNLGSLDTTAKLETSVAFPIGGNKTHSKFMGIIEPVDVVGFGWSLSSTDNNSLTLSNYLYIGSFEVFSFTIDPFIENYCSFAEFTFYLLADLPTDYQFQAVGGNPQSYLPYWCIEQFTSHTLYTYFVRKFPLPLGYYNQELTIYASFLNPSTVNFGTFGQQSTNQPPTIDDILLIETPSISLSVAGGYIIRFKISNLNGDQFSHLDINEQRLYAINIVSGDTYNEGYFELHVNNSFIQSMSKLFYINACNIKFGCENKFYLPSQFTNYQPFPSLILPSYKFITIFDISYIKFVENNLNTTNQSKNNRIYLRVNNLSGSGDASTILFKLDNYNRENNDFISFGWNSTLGMFECKFEIPANYYTGNIDYFIRVGNHTYSYSSIYSVIGSNSTLSVASKNADMIPPLVTNIITYPEESTLKLNITTNSNVFGWDIQIDEGVNGFKFGEFNVTGRYDKLSYQFKFNETDFINGQGILSIRVHLDELVCITQDYTISSVYLLDKQGYSTSKTPLETISPMFKEFLPLPIIVECPENVIEYNSSNPDMGVPFISAFIIDPDFNYIDYSLNNHHAININFTITDNESGLSQRHHPTFYFEDMFGNIISSTVGSGMKVVESSIQERSYSCVVEFPYGFAFPGGAVISIYGIVDRFMNIKGYNPISLKEQVAPFSRDYSLTPLISVGFSSSAPYIADLAPTFSSDWKTAQFVLKGSFFGLSKSDVGLSIKYVAESTSSETTTTTTTSGLTTTSGNSNPAMRTLLTEDSDVVPFDIVFFSGNQLVIEADLSNALSQNIQIVFNVSGQLSNTFNLLLPTQVLNPTTTTTDGGSSATTGGVSTTTTGGVSTDGGSSATTGGVSTTATTTTGSTVGFDCSKQSDCGGSGQGVCISQDTCSCINSWVGVDCMSKPLEGISISVNPNAPSASLNQEEDSNGFKLSSLINLYQMREINSFDNNKIIHQFDLQDKWVPITSNSIPNQYVYSNSLSNGQGTIIYATISVYEQQSTFEFAGVQYSINPNSIKFSINITSYQVENPLNNVELIMQAQLNSTQTDDVCTKKTITHSSNSDQLSVQINNKSLYCRFLNSALIDGVKVVNNLTHVNLNNEFSALIEPNSGQYYYGITLPSFSNYVLLDPDFSLLLESDTLQSGDENDGTTCSPFSKSNKISNGAIAGIVVGGVVFLTICVIAVMSLMFRKHRFSSFTMNVRKWTANRRNRNSFSLKNFN